MHRLRRSVRFTINPFLEADSKGANSFSSKPSGEGLGVFLELNVELEGGIDPATGFLVNVVDIDRAVREYAVPVFAQRIRSHYRKGGHIGFCQIAALLRRSWAVLKGRFGSANLKRLGLKLNPYREAAIHCGDFEMLYYGEKFEFAAMHKLWNTQLTDEENLATFGKCANPSGHGHNYVIEVTVKTGPGDLKVGRFEQIIDTELIERIDHKNLNVDVDYFADTNPTVENIAVFAWECLEGKLGGPQLHCITVWETDKTCCSYYGGPKD